MAFTVNVNVSCLSLLITRCIPDLVRNLRKQKSPTVLSSALNNLLLSPPITLYLISNVGSNTNIPILSEAVTKVLATEFSSIVPLYASWVNLKFCCCSIAREVCSVCDSVVLSWVSRIKPNSIQATDGTTNVEYCRRKLSLRTQRNMATISSTAAIFFLHQVLGGFHWAPKYLKLYKVMCDPPAKWKHTCTFVKQEEFSAHKFKAISMSRSH